MKCLDTTNKCKIDYKDAVPIRVKPNVAWEVNIEEREKHIILISPDVTVVELVAIVKNQFPGKKFTVQHIWVGDFVISKCVSGYSHDGRKINQNLKMV